MRLERRLLVATIVAVLLPAAAARADGQSIATATPIAFGQHESGNLANGFNGVAGTYSSCSAGTNYNSYWSMAVSAGDTVTIDWEAQSVYIELEVFPPGITDFTVMPDNGNAVARQSIGDGLKNELVYQATRTGVMPVIFENHGDFGCGWPPGPYGFTATLKSASCPPGQTGTPPNCAAPLAPAPTSPPPASPPVTPTPSAVSQPTSSAQESSGCRNAHFNYNTAVKRLLRDKRQHRSARVIRRDKTSARQTLRAVGAACR